MRVDICHCSSAFPCETLLEYSADWSSAWGGEGRGDAQKVRDLGGYMTWNKARMTQNTKTLKGIDTLSVDFDENAVYF